MTVARTAGRLVVHVALAAAIASVVAMILMENWPGAVQFAIVGMAVGYTDTIVDLLAGMLGSLVAGALVLIWARHRNPSGTGRA